MRSPARVVAELDGRLCQAPFQAPSWLKNPHAQTFWSPAFRPRRKLPWRLEELATPDGDHLRLYFLESARVERRRDVGSGGPPTLLMLHGLEGSVQSNYVGGLATRMAARGWTVVLMEFRTCGGVLNKARRMYHSGETTDIAWTARHLAQRIDEGALGGPLFVSGVSLGGNVVAKWLGEDPDVVPAALCGAASISLPFDLEVSGPAVDTALGGFYRWRFLRTLREKALAKERQYPGCLDPELVRRGRSFIDFDTHATARLHGFEDCWDYWNQSGCGQFLHQVDRPLLLIASQDDPFNPGTAIPMKQIEKHPMLLGQFPTTGGHVGFVAGAPWKTDHWAEEQVERFFVGLWEALV